MNPNQIFSTEEEADTDCKSEGWCSEHKTAEECQQSCHSLTGKKRKNNKKILFFLKILATYVLSERYQLFDTQKFLE